MSELSVTKHCQRRRRFSGEFNAQIIAKCQEPGASASRILLDNGLNANMVRSWMSGHSGAVGSKTAQTMVQKGEQFILI